MTDILRGLLSPDIDPEIQARLDEERKNGLAAQLGRESSQYRARVQSDFPAYKSGDMSLGRLVFGTPEEQDQAMALAQALGGNFIGATMGGKSHAGRLQQLYHGTKASLGPEVAAQGFKRGKSAELSIPGTSVSFDPTTSREFSGNSGPIFKVDPGGITPNEVYNLRPSQYATGDYKDAFAKNAQLIRKPQSYFPEAEYFAPARTGGQGRLMPHSPTRGEMVKTETNYQMNRQLDAALNSHDSTSFLAAVSEKLPVSPGFEPTLLRTMAEKIKGYADDSLLQYAAPKISSALSKLRRPADELTTLLDRGPADPKGVEFDNFYRDKTKLTDNFRRAHEKAGFPSTAVRKKELMDFKYLNTNLPGGLRLSEWTQLARGNGVSPTQLVDLVKQVYKERPPVLATRLRELITGNGGGQAELRSTEGNPQPVQQFPEGANPVGQLGVHYPGLNQAWHDLANKYYAETGQLPFDKGSPGNYKSTPEFMQWHEKQLNAKPTVPWMTSGENKIFQQYLDGMLTDEEAGTALGITKQQLYNIVGEVMGGQ